VSLAAVEGEIDGPGAGLRALEAIDDPTVERFQPAWSTRAHLLARAGRTDAAADAYRRAIDLTRDTGIRDYLMSLCERLG
jgi:RNA polymerase sigma-70 factor (ECF subfamily)